MKWNKKFDYPASSRALVSGEGFDCGYGERRSVAANVRYSF